MTDVMQINRLYDLGEGGWTAHRVLSNGAPIIERFALLHRSIVTLKVRDEAVLGRPRREP